METFFDMVRSVFSFLEDEHGFEARAVTPRFVRFVLGDMYIVVVHGTPLPEVSLAIGAFSLGNQGHYSLDMLSRLIPPGIMGYDRMATTPEAVRAALVELAELFRIYGKRVMAGDVSVFEDLERQCGR